jgi:hypothetical protein
MPRKVTRLSFVMGLWWLVFKPFVPVFSLPESDVSNMNQESPSLSW